ncbi:exported hypothetical protein [Curtobacterium sp. 8I-2]|nr:exported hypothetical protein [Curtobacterium sp. 8I-2]
MPSSSASRPPSSWCSSSRACSSTCCTPPSTRASGQEPPDDHRSPRRHRRTRRRGPAPATARRRTDAGVLGARVGARGGPAHRGVPAAVRRTVRPRRPPGVRPRPERGVSDRRAPVRLRPAGLRRVRERHLGHPVVDRRRGAHDPARRHGRGRRRDRRGHGRRVGRRGPRPAHRRVPRVPVPARRGRRAEQRGGAVGAHRVAGARPVRLADDGPARAVERPQRPGCRVRARCPDDGAVDVADHHPVRAAVVDLAAARARHHHRRRGHRVRVVADLPRHRAGASGDLVGAAAVRGDVAVPPGPAHAHRAGGVPRRDRARRHRARRHAPRRARPTSALTCVAADAAAIDAPDSNHRPSKGPP